MVLDNICLIDPLKSGLESLRSSTFFCDSYEDNSITKYKAFKYEQLRTLYLNIVCKDIP